MAVSALALTFSTSAQAGASRTFIGTTGRDANIAVCSASAACRTFAAALLVTNPDGEIVVVNPGGDGPATISQPVIITAIGVDASISVTTFGAAGLTINTGGNVTLIGLNLHSEATGGAGIEVPGRPPRHDAVGHYFLFGQPGALDFGGHAAVIVTQEPIPLFSSLR